MSTKIYSVLIGVDVYDDAAITNLLCAAADAHAVAHRLRRLDATVVVVPAARLTGDAVFDHIDRAREALSSAGEDSLFIFYFAGHGKTWRSGALSDHLLLLPSARARTLNRPSLAGIPGILSWQSLMAQLADFPGRCLAILDACRSPLSVEGARDGDGIARFDGIEVLTRDFAPLLTNHGRIAPCTVINSCGQGQQAREVSGLGGVFSTLFNGVLDDAWDAGQRELRLDSQSFEQLLRPRMDRLYEEHRLPRTEQQAPLISGPPVVIPMRVDEPEAPHTAPPVDTANVREELLWEAACLENTVEAYKGYLRDTALATHGREALDKINALLEQGRQASAEEAARYTEAKRKAEEQEAKRKAEEAARRKAEQEREEDARRKAEAAAAKQQAEREAQEKARIESERKAREEEEVRRKAEAAARAAEAAVWARAESADTAEAWAGFVREHPQSPRRAEAEKRERAARERAAVAAAQQPGAQQSAEALVQPVAAAQHTPMSTPSPGSKLPWVIAGVAVLGLAVVGGSALLSGGSGKQASPSASAAQASPSSPPAVSPPAAAPAAPVDAPRPSLPKVQYIHGWSTSQVQALQKETAAALGYAHAQDVTIAGCGAICGHYVVVPPGQYTMGSPESEKGYENEWDQQRVTINYALLVGKHAVTFAQWDACVADGACKETPATEWGRGQQPVMRVSWDMIRNEFLPWLNRKAGLSDRPEAERFRLLSESEWEYMARAGSTGPYSFDGMISPARVNYNSSSTPTYGGSRVDKAGYRGRTVEVGSLPANPWGLHEVHGNVLEWVEDCWHASYKGAPDNGSAWTTGCVENRLVQRGGSWSGRPRDTRSANRNWGTPGLRYYGGGFRVARMLPGE